jgi:MoCo/4Fe-4S cofactor protein with predicted Tat translocation signal
MDSMSDNGHEKKLRILQGPAGEKAALPAAHEHDEQEHEAEDDTVREHRLELSTVREKLKNKSGKQYWRTLEELADDPHFEELMHREFPRHASEWDDAVDRRDFLKLMGASLALAGLAGCGRPDESHITPYVKQPDGMTLGRPNFYATAMPFGADAVGVLVESHEGRPTKIEGNPDHPSSLGGTSAMVQASILNLYDPDRAQTVMEGGEIRAWSRFLDVAQESTAAVKATAGANFRILTGTITSPTLAWQIRKLLALYPQAKWHQWEPAVSDGAREGAKLAFGRAVNTVNVPAKADVILSLDADFLASGPGHIAYAKQFARRRNLDGASAEMNRLYVVEPTPTVTGSMAEHKLPMRACDVELFALVLAAKLGQKSLPGLPPAAEKWLDGVAADLQKARGSSLVIAGEQQSAAVHALTHTINAALGNVGTTVYYTEPVEAEPVNQLESLRDLCSDMDKGKVDLLVILGGNPVYDAPHDFDFVSKLKKVNTSVHLSPYFDETSAYCQWHVSESHYLESWSDARAYDGTASIVQPLISPLYYTKSAHDVVSAFSDKPGQPPYDTLRAYWTEASAKLGSSADAGWRKWLNDGVIPGTKFAPITPQLKSDATGVHPTLVAADQVEYIFRPDPSVYDGRFANNGWLQELPKPVTKLTWDNAALVSPKFAQKQDLAHKVVSRGGEHGQIRATVVDIALNGSKVTAATWTTPGQAENTVVLPLGYGRTRAGYTGTNKGFNAYAVRTSNALWSATGGTMTATGDGYSLACTQYHFNMEGRQILSTGSLEEYKKDPGFPHEGFEAPEKDNSLYKAFEYPGHAWGMAIDLTKCNGCNACVVACQSENNIPVVGKDQVMRGREMHWIRIDRYYTHSPSATVDNTGDPTVYSPALDNPETHFQPVPCMQCENAPCEQVCPVGATVHSAEGLNDMVYNRCVGTRYCSNNCPYKVRRFNFLRFQDWETPQLKLLRNPEVTVRSRGVMEKCTYCVQRINNVRIDAEKQNRPIKDGEIVTACESACPSEAIAFGDINDPNSKVAKLKAQQRNYTVLGELNSRPRTTYLAAVRNPNAELEKA